MRRLFWVAVGAAAGVYAVRKVQQAMHAYSPSGLAERATDAGGAVRGFLDEVLAGMAEREQALRQALGMTPEDDGRLTDALSPADAADLLDRPAAPYPARTRPRSRT